MTTNIEIRHQIGSTTIRSEKSDLTFSRTSSPIIQFHCSAKLTSPMMDDIENSGIVTVLSVDFIKGLVILETKDFYDHAKFTEVLTFIYEKYDL
ncbi:hypothetical protein MASR1M31_03280 [Porphyromonadaceae bacterium]